MEKLFILIAEDDEDDRFLLKAAFEENKFSDELFFVENGMELLEYLHSQNRKNSVEKNPHFILLDLNMPKKNGKEVLKEIKANKVFCKIPIIIFSTTNNEQEKKYCMELDAVAYFTKPVSYTDLISTVAEIRNIGSNSYKNR